MRKFFISIFLVSILSLTFSAYFVLAAEGDSVSPNIPPSPTAVTLTNPLGVDTPQALIGRIINSVLGVVGSIALLMFVYGGLIWMTSSGNPDKVKKGRDTLVWSAIGLVVIFSAYGLTRYVLATVAGSGGGAAQ